VGVDGDSKDRNLEWVVRAGEWMDMGGRSESESSFPSESDSREESGLGVVVVVVRRAATDAHAALRRRQTRTKRRIKKRRLMMESSADLEGIETCWVEDLRVVVTAASEMKSGGDERERFG
jgi:hypothetical protein